MAHYTHVIDDIRAFDFMLSDEQQQEQDDDHEQEADRDELVSLHVCLHDNNDLDKVLYNPYAITDN